MALCFWLHRADYAAWVRKAEQAGFTGPWGLARWVRECAAVIASRGVVGSVGTLPDPDTAEPVGPEDPAERLFRAVEKAARKSATASAAGRRRAAQGSRPAIGAPPRLRARSRGQAV